MPAPPWFTRQERAWWAEEMAGRAPVRTMTHIPPSVLGLTEVVRAFENADVAALNTALDQVDPAVLNWLPRMKTCRLLGDNTKEYEYALFDALALDWPHIEASPLTLLSCATFVIAGGGPFASGNKWSWVNARTDDEWLAVYTALVNHPSVDVNTALEVEDVLADQEAYAQEYRNAGGGGDEFPHLHDECLSAWDYCWSANNHALREGDWTDPASQDTLQMRMLCALARSGKLNIERKTHIAMNWTSPLDRDDVISTTLYNGMFAAVHDLLSLGDEIVPIAAKALRLGRENGPYCHHYVQLESDPAGNVALKAVAARITRYKRDKLLAYIRCMVRLRILLARWWASARETAYAPEGAGAKRARVSFDASRA